MYKIKWIGNLDGSSHKGKAVYSPYRGGNCYNNKYGL